MKRVAAYLLRRSIGKRWRLDAGQPSRTNHPGEEEPSTPFLSIPLGALAEPARGGYRRFLGWTMALLPLPQDWLRARSILAPIASAAMRGSCANGELRDALLDGALAAYGVSHEEISPLLTWLSG